PLTWPYEVKGTIYGRPIQTSEKVNVTLSTATAPSPSEITESNELNHSTWFTISGGPERQPVEITLKLKQEGYKETTSETQTRQLDGEALAKDNWATCNYYPGCKSNASDTTYKTNWSVCSKYSWNSQEDSYTFQTQSGIPGSYAGFPAFGISAVGPDYQVPADSKNKPIELTFSLKANENVYGGKLRVEVPEKWPVWGVNPEDLYYYPKGCALENASIEYPAPMLDPLLGNDETQHPNRSMKWRCDATSPTGAPANADVLINFVKSQGYSADDCRQFVKIFNATVGGTTYQADSEKSFVEIPVGDLNKDAVVTGKAFIVPLVPQDKPLYGWRSGVTATFSGSFSKEFLEPATARKSQYVGRYCDTITGRDCAPEDIQDTDRCFLFVHVNYTDEKGIRVLLNADENGAFEDVQMAGMYNCKGIKFSPNGLTPTGWLITSVESAKTLTVKINTDESENPDAASCYSSAQLNIQTGEIIGSWSPGFTGFTRLGFNVVKYDASACPTDYKLFGNKIPETSLEINITATGVTDPKKNTVAVALKGGINNYLKKRYMGFFIAPVATTFLHNSDGSIDQNYGAPQLWSIINNAQWGSRKIVVKMTGGSGSIANAAAPAKLSYGSYDANGLLDAVSKLSRISYALPGDGALPPGDEYCTPGDQCGPGSGKVCPQGQTCDITMCECQGAEPTPTAPPGGNKVGIPPKTDLKELTFEFDGPGAQFFTYAPTPGSKLAFYEEVDGELKEITGTKGLLSVVEGTYASPYGFWAEYTDYASDPMPEEFVATLGNDVYDENKFDYFAKQIGFKPGQVANLVHAKIMGKETLKTGGKTYANLRFITWQRPDGELKADYYQPLNVFTGFSQASPLDKNTEDCSDNGKYKNQGVFLLHYAVEGDKKVGQGELTATVVHVTKDKQFGYACSKEGAAWDDVELCAPTYADFSRFGACW
ncbi:hypothetical protein H0N96_02100, partial [Candidatus Micrarchaeota archaeon]|nr:hypothetical protein [Candidatus Micrarchaeota archaeon]